MTLKQAEYLVAIVRHGSITKASKELFVAQSALSAAIKQLEKEFNLIIFCLGSKGVELTMAGREFAEDIQHMLDQCEYVTEKYSKPPQEIISLSVSTQHHICGEGAFLRMAELYQKNNFRLAYLACNTETLLDNVENGVSDFGLFFYYLSVKNIVIQDLRNRGMLFNHIAYRKPHIYVHNSQPLASQAFVLAGDLHHYPSISYDASGSGASLYTATLRRASPHMQTYYVNDRASAYTIMRKTDAYATGTGYLPEDEAYTDIVSIPIEGKESLEVGYIVKGKYNLSEAAEKMISFIKQMY